MANEHLTEEARAALANAQGNAGVQAPIYSNAPAVKTWQLTMLLRWKRPEPVIVGGDIVQPDAVLQQASQCRETGEIKWDAVSYET